MSNDDGDKMKDSKHPPEDGEKVVNLSSVIVVVAKLGILLLLLFIAVRMPPLWMKIGGSFAVLMFGWRWLPGSGKRKRALLSDQTYFEAGKVAEVDGDYQTAIKHYEKALGGKLKPNHIAVRLLVCYDAAGEFGRTKTMIQNLDGSEFPETAAAELSELTARYFPVKLEKTQGGVRLKLV